MRQVLQNRLVLLAPQTAAFSLDADSVAVCCGVARIGNVSSLVRRRFVDFASKQAGFARRIGQLAFGLKPVLHIASMAAAALLE